MTRPLNVLCALLVASAAVHAAEFNGSAHIEIADTGGDLSWKTGTGALTVQCWFKLSFPSTATFTSSERMIILADRRTGSDTSVYSYLVWLNFNTGNIEFQARDGSTTYSGTLIEKPFLDRWYHIAVVRSGSSVTGYVDGAVVSTMNNVSTGLGNTGNTDGIAIGGWGSYRRLLGEAQEVRIFQAALTQDIINEDMFADLAPGDWGVSLRGYYKLAYSADPANHLRNFAASPPAGIGPAAIVGTQTAVTFPETDEKGEQSLFDSRRNDSRDAIASLSGAHGWSGTLLHRTTKGVPLTLAVAYSSSLGTTDNNAVGSSPPLSAGWRHSFEQRVQLLPDGKSLALTDWTGNTEVWDRLFDGQGNGYFASRHGEYRGELALTGPTDNSNTKVVWTTPERLKYTFASPYSALSSSLDRGRLLEIGDFRDQKILIVRFTSGVLRGQVNTISDCAGGVYQFTYDVSNRISLITFNGQGWSIAFNYNADNLLADYTITGPSKYSAAPTTWNFQYKTVLGTKKLLYRTQEPRIAATGSTTVFTEEVDYDAQGRRTLSKDALGRNTTFQYNVPALRQLTMTDPRGKAWITTYDRKSRVIQTRDPLGNAISTEYDVGGNPIKVTDPLGRITRATYDVRGNALERIDALGNRSLATYENAAAASLNLPLTQTDPSGWVQRFVYSATGQLTRHYDDLGDLVQYTYSAAGQPLTSADARGNITTFTYTPEGFLASRLDPGLGTASTFVSTELGWGEQETNPLGQTLRRSFDRAGRVVRVQDALGRVVKTEFDGSGNVLKQYDAKGNFTANVYNYANERTTTTTRDGRLTSFTYTPTGKVDTVTDPLGRVAQNTYDDADRLVKVSQTVASVEYKVETTFDAAGNPVTTTDQEGRSWQRAYDAMNRVIGTRDPLGNTTAKTYDVNGRVATTTNARGAVSQNTYDGRGRLQTWRDGQGGVWTYSYDAGGNITKITDALGGEYAMTYGPRNERLTELNQDGFLWTYGYDPLLRPLSETDPNGRVKTLSYDAGGRVQSTAYSTGRVDIFAYDENNNLVSLTRADAGQPPATSLLGYDVMDRVISHRDPHSKSVGYTYDELGRRKTLVYPDGFTLTYGYDELGRLTSQTDWASRQTTYQYDKAGRLTRRTYPNGIVQSLSYDSAGRPLTYRFTQGDPATGPEKFGYAYQWDGNGNLTRSAEKGTPDWTPPSPPPDERSRFTASGRLIDKVDACEATGVKDWTYAYDPAGNMGDARRGDGARYQLQYDEQNRTTRIQWTPGTSPQTYEIATAVDIRNRYDALGRRVARVRDGTETRFVLDLAAGMERILCDTDATGTITARYVHGPDLCYKEDTATGSITCFLPNVSGNIVQLTNQTGATEVSYAYTPYGRTLTVQPASSSNPYTFVGSQGVMEELPGLFFMRARYYSPDNGAFLSVDPIRRNGQSWTSAFFTYAAQNPNIIWDPNGEAYMKIGLTEWEAKAQFGPFGGSLSGSASFEVDDEMQTALSAEGEGSLDVGFGGGLHASLVEFGSGNIDSGFTESDSSGVKVCFFAKVGGCLSAGTDGVKVQLGVGFEASASLYTSKSYSYSVPITSNERSNSQVSRSNTTQASNAFGQNIRRSGNASLGDFPKVSQTPLKRNFSDADAHASNLNSKNTSKTAQPSTVLSNGSSSNTRAGVNASSGPRSPASIAARAAAFRANATARLRASRGKISR